MNNAKEIAEIQARLTALLEQKAPPGTDPARAEETDLLSLEILRLVGPALLRLLSTPATAAEIRLAAGEMTAGEMRTAKAVIGWQCRKASALADTLGTLGLHRQ